MIKIFISKRLQKKTRVSLLFSFPICTEVFSTVKNTGKYKMKFPRFLTNSLVLLNRESDWYHFITILTSRLCKDVFNGKKIVAHRKCDLISEVPNRSNDIISSPSLFLGYAKVFSTKKKYRRMTGKWKMKTRKMMAYIHKISLLYILTCSRRNYKRKRRRFWTNPIHKKIMKWSRKCGNAQNLEKFRNI